MSIVELRERLRDIPGIENLTMQSVMGRQLFGLNGKLIGVPMTADDGEVEGTIRAAMASTLTAAEIVKVLDASPIPSGALLAPVTMAEAPKVQPMPPAAPGSFAASLKALMDDARAGIIQARADGRAKVSEALGLMTEAQAATRHVTDAMASTIKAEADDVMTELRQITNDLGV